MRGSRAVLLAVLIGAVFASRVQANEASIASQTARVAPLAFVQGSVEASSSDKSVGDTVNWTEDVEIDSDDCVSIPFVGTICHTVKYRFEFQGSIASIDHGSQQYRVLLTSRKLVQQEWVSPMYWTYKDRAQNWADQQTYRSVAFKQVR